MVHNNTGIHRITEALADATGRSEDEERLALTLAVVGAVVTATIRVLEFLGNLGLKAFRYAASR
jgi:hypothetical protein